MPGTRTQKRKRWERVGFEGVASRSTGRERHQRKRGGTGGQGGVWIDVAMWPHAVDREKREGSLRR